MRSRTIGRALALTIAMTLAVNAPFISIKASAAQNDGESSWEEKLRAILRAGGQAGEQGDRIKERMRALSAEPHHVGSAADKRNAEWIRDQMKSWGLDATIEEFDVLFPTPKERLLELTEPEKYQAKLKEPAIPEDPDSGDENQLPTYNAYSGDGDVTAQLVYVNYGVPADYEQLAKMGVDVNFKIARGPHSSSLCRFTTHLASAAAMDAAKS